MDAKDFAAKVKSGIPAKLQKYTRVAEFVSVGTPVVQIDFAYTDSKDGTDRLNARSFRMLVQGWKRDGSVETVEVSAVRSHDIPKFRRRSGQPAKIVQYIVNYLQRAERGLVEGEPYVNSLKVGSYKLASEMSPEVAAQVGAIGIRIVLSKVFHNEDALRSYLKLHPKADPSKHSVKGKPSGKDKPKGDEDKGKPSDKGKKPGLKDLSGQPGFSKLKGLSPEKQREVIERALEMGKPKDQQKEVPKDLSDQYKVLKGLSPREQRKVIERALKMASQPLHEALTRVAATLPSGDRRLSVLKLASFTAECVKEGKADITVLRKVQDMVSPWDKAVHDAVSDIIWMGDDKDKKDTAKILYDMLRLQTQDASKTMQNLKRQYKLSSEDQIVFEALVKQAAAETDPTKKAQLLKQALGLGPGSGFENERSMLRIHRYMDSIRVTDLTNAGKRGKKVDEFAVYDLDYATDKGAVDRLAAQLAKSGGYRLALSLAQSWVEYYDDHKIFPHPKINQIQLRGVDVTPAGFKPIKIETPHVSIEADYKDWHVYDKYDRNNEPACAANGNKSVKQFYRWVQDNQSRLKSMPFRDIVKALMSEGIQFRQWCRMASNKTAGAKPTAANLMLMAGQLAAKAFSKGERYGGRANSTTYPKKWYRELERMFGPLSAVALSYFDDAYTHHMAQLTYERTLRPPPVPAGLDKQAAGDVEKELAAKKASEHQAQGYRIGPGGLEKPSKGITLQPDTVYWMGASSSPSMIIVTKVTDDSIEYMDPYNKQKRKIQRWIGEDLIMQGSKTWLSSYARYQPEMAKSIRSMLNGGPGKKEKMRDWDRVRITVRAKDPSQDLWRVAEQYGNVAGIDDDDGVMLYEIEGFRGSVEKVKKDNRFTVKSEKKIGSRVARGKTFESWWNSFREGYGKSSSSLRQLEGFFHYRLFDRDGRTKMDGTPVLTPQEEAAAKKSYAKLQAIEKAYEEAWKHIRDFERDVRALDNYMGYTG